MCHARVGITQDSHETNAGTGRHLGVRVVQGIDSRIEHRPQRCRFHPAGLDGDPVKRVGEVIRHFTRDQCLEFRAISLQRNLARLPGADRSDYRHRGEDRGRNRDAGSVAAYELGCTVARTGRPGNHRFVVQVPL